MKPKIYGIPNCDTVRKARKWLQDNGIDYQFVDVRETSPTEKQLKGWIDAVGAATLVNKRSTSWRELSDSDKAAVEGGNVLPALMANPTLIKRPVLEYQDAVDVGFKAADYAAKFGV